jgi:hypothetical protein
MPSKTAYERKSKWKATVYRGERTIGGNIVYAGENLLDKHLFVHNAAQGGFDWGPDADDERACQLAVALLAPTRGVDTAVEDHHIFAGNVVKQKLTGDSWEIKQQELRGSSNLEKRLDRDYPENTAPRPDDVPDLDDSALDLEAITYAEEIALANKYEDVLWTHGNRRENLQRLLDIWAGEVEPSSDSTSGSTLYHILPGLSSAARNTLKTKFETMGDLAAWVMYCRNHSGLKGISDTSAEKIRDSRSNFVRYFGGEDYIPAFDDETLSLQEVTGSRRDAGQATLG